MRLILSMLASYALILVGGMTAFYYFNLGDVERSLGEATHEAIVEKLAQSPDLEFDPSQIAVTFKARKGHVSGITASEEALSATLEAVEEIAREGLGVQVYEVKSLTSDLKRRATCQISSESGEVYLRAYLPRVALASVRAGINRARNSDPLPDGSQESAAAEEDDAAHPEWEESIGDFVERFFDARVRDAELRVVAGKEVFLAGEMNTPEEAQDIVDYAKACFPSLANKLDNQIRIRWRPQPVVIKASKDRVVIEAQVASAEVRERLFELIHSQAAPGQAFENAIQVSEEAPDIPWLDKEPTFFKGFLSSIKRLSITIGPDTVLIRGHAPSMEAAQELEGKVARQLSDHTVANRMSHPESAVIPLDPPKN